MEQSNEILQYCRSLKKLIKRKHINKIKTLMIYMSDSIPYDITIQYFDEKLNNVRISKGAKMLHKIYTFEKKKLNIPPPYDKGMYALMYNMPTNTADICVVAYENGNKND